MCILIDPTEARHRTRLPQAVIEQAVILPGLEALTGADVLVALDKPPSDVRDIAGDSLTGSVCHLAWRGWSVRRIGKEVGRPLPFVLKVLKFRKACKSGLLSQRKTGRDACSIIPNSRGAVILEKMLNWCPECWLTFVDARIESGRSSKMIVNGKETGYLYNQFDGAVDAWKRRGGFVKWIPRDKDLVVWLSRQLDYLRTRTDEKVLSLRKPVQRIVGPDSDKSRKLSILAGLKHIGAEKARRLLEHYNWNLAAALEAVLDPGFALYKDKPSGIGETTVVENRQLFELNEPWMRMIVVAEPPKET